MNTIAIIYIHSNIFENFKLLIFSDRTGRS